MKHRFFLLLLFCSISVFSQDKIHDCTFYLKNESCLKNFLVDKLLSDIDDELKSKIERNIFYVDVFLTFNNLGEINPIRSDFFSDNLILWPKLDSLINNFPKLEFEDNIQLKTKDNVFSRKLFFELDPISNKIQYVDDFNEKDYDSSLSVVEKVPVFQGCNSEKSNAYLKRCMSKAISKHISSQFNTEIVEEIKLSGLIEILVGFRVDKEGYIFSVRAKAPHPKLAAEAERVIKLLPKLKRAGFSNEKAVIVPYAIPINFHYR